MTEKTPPPADEIWIFVGKRNIMDYVYAAMTRLKGKRKIVIRARGNSIPDAVSVAEVLKRKLNKEAIATISSFETQNRFGKSVYVSEISIEIIL